MKNDANLRETLIQFQMFLKRFVQILEIYLFTLSAFFSLVYCSAQVDVKSIWKDYQYVPERIEEFVWKRENGFCYLKKDTLYSKSFLEKEKNLFTLSDIQKKDSLVYDFSNFSFSPSENFLLVETNPESIYRHSQTANYFVLDTKANVISKIDSSQIQIPTFSPDEKKILFFQRNNLFQYSIENKKIIQVKMQLTSESILP